MCIHVCVDLAHQGDLISVCYTGTGSVLTPLMKSGKSTMLTNFTHLKRTVGRLYKHNFEDKSRQECFELILGKHQLSGDVPLDLSPVVLPLACLLETENFSDEPELSIWCGTWNTGGGATLINDDLSAWLLPQIQKNNEYDIFCVCLEEIVNVNVHAKCNTQK